MFFFFNDTATTEIYTLSLHDALPISVLRTKPGVERAFLATGRGAPHVVDHGTRHVQAAVPRELGAEADVPVLAIGERSEEHTSELQSRQYLVCRLLLEKKKNLMNHTP